MVLKSRESRVNFNQWSQAHRNLNEIHFERPKKASSDYTHHYYLVFHLNKTHNLFKQPKIKTSKNMAKRTQLNGDKS